MLLQRTLLLSLILLLSAELFAVNENAGITGFNCLQIVQSARAIGLSEAMTGMTENIEGLEFNPASILGIDDYVVASTFNNYFVDTRGGGLHFVYPQDERTTFGFLLHYLNFGEMERTEVTSGNEYVETDETFGAYNLIAGISFARTMNEAIDLGSTLKFTLDRIDRSSASALAFDLGLVHRPVNEKIKVGLAVRNLGLQTSYYTEKKNREKLPFTFSAGLSYQLKPALTATLDISKPRSSDLTGRFGMEYSMSPLFKLRMGYSSKAGDWKTGGGWDWSSGFSFGTGFVWSNYVLDYGIASYGDLGFINQLTLQYRF